MKSIKDLLALRRQLKKRKPNFLREDYDKFENKHVGMKWRRPTGRHSKLKHQFKGSRKMPSCGYRSPVEVRGMTRKGFMPVVVFNVEDLSKIDPKTETVVISSTVGIKKRMLILKAIADKKLPIEHVKDVTAELKKYEDYLKQKKDTKKQQAVAKEQKAAQKTEKKEEKKTELPAAEHKAEATNEQSVHDDKKKTVKKKKLEGEAK